MEEFAGGKETFLKKSFFPPCTPLSSKNFEKGGIGIEYCFVERLSVLKGLFYFV